MSIAALNWAREAKTGSPALKAVLLILADHADQWGTVWAGQETISAEAEVTKRSVQRYLHLLRKKKLLRIYQLPRRDGGWRNLYEFEGFKPKPKDRMPDDHPRRDERLVRLVQLEGDKGPLVRRPVDLVGAEHDDKLSPCHDDSPVATPWRQDVPAMTTGRAHHDDSWVAPEPIEPIRTPSRVRARGERAARRRSAGTADDDAANAVRTADPERPSGVSNEDWARWQAMLGSLARSVGEASFHSWCAALRFGGVGDGAIRVVAPSRFIRDHVASRYGSELRAASSAAFGSDEVEIVASGGLGFGSGAGPNRADCETWPRRRGRVRRER